MTSKDEEAKDARFKIVACELANGSKVDLDYTSLHLGENVLKYTPTQPGTRALTIKVEVGGGEEPVQIFHYTTEVSSTDWHTQARLR